MHSTENLYNSRLRKVRWFVKRFGAAELIRKPVRQLLAPWIIARLAKSTFPFRGHQIDYFYHPYNMTWATERCLEVPIARGYLQSAKSSEVLEVGNVLSHYAPVSHEILDKFERGPGIINQDIVSFAPAKKYRLILSISTFEHIGFDDDTIEGSKDKILRAIKGCRQLLQRDGKLVMTVPLGYNPELDQIILAGELGAEREDYFRRTGTCEWQTASKAAALRCHYRRPYPYANALLVAEIGPTNDRAASPCES